MNCDTLAHHARLNEFYYNQQTSKTPQTSAHSRQCHLSPDKYQAVGQWCSRINAIFLKPRRRQAPVLFRKCKYSDAMFPPNKSTVRSQSAPGVRLWTDQGERKGVRSAVLTGERVKSGKKPERRTKAGESVVSRMAESARYYEAERKVIHLNIQPQWKRKLSTGWTINRPLLYPSNTADSSPQQLHMNQSNQTAKTTPEAGTTEVEPVHSSTVKDSQRDTETSVNRDNNKNFKDTNNKTKNSSLDSTSELDKKSKTQDSKNKNVSDKSAIPDNTKDIVTLRSKQKLIISDRSWSNDMLNVLSVDDCRMRLRHRPKRVMDSQDTMITPQPRQASGGGEEQGGEGQGQEGERSSSPHNTLIHLSQGSATTILTQSRVQSQAQAYKQSSLMGGARTQRPFSAAVQRAFDALLEPSPNAQRSSQRPQSSPCRLDSGSRPSSSDPTIPSQRFQQMNAALRRQMYDFLDSRRFNKGQRQSLSTAVKG